MNIFDRLIKKEGVWDENTIRAKCLENHQCEGMFEGHKWGLKLAYCEKRGDAIKVIDESCCRFNQSEPVVTLWLSEKDLADYEKKRAANHHFTKVQREKLWSQFERDEKDRLEKRTDMGLKTDDSKIRRQDAESRIEMRILNSLPYSPMELSTSHMVCVDLDLTHYEVMIKNRERDLLVEHGNLPANKTIIPFWIMSGYQPVLLVNWNVNEK